MRARLTRLDLLADAKIGDLDTAFIVHKDIGALDVPVDDLPLVQVVQTHKDLAHKVAHERFFEGTIVVQQRGDRAAGHVLEKNVQVVSVGRRVCQSAERHVC